MDDGSQLPWIFVILLMFCAAFFALTETAISSCPRIRIKAADEHGDPRAKEALSVLDRFDLAVTTLLILTNIAHISIAALVTVIVTRKWGLSAVSIGTVVTTIAVFFLAEMLPKSIAKKFCERCTLSTAKILCFLMKICSPLANLLMRIGATVSSRTPGEPEISVTENELYDIIEDMTEEGALDEAQGDLISSALQFGDVTVESVLTPRVDVTAVDAAMPIPDMLALVRETNHSRLPVYEGSIDHITGILLIRSFIRAYLKEGESLALKPLLTEPLFVHQSTKLDDLLPMMSRRRSNLAVVTDNFGGTLGIVTVEDILEELVGEIWDEEDVVEEPIVLLGEGKYAVEAEESVDDVFEAVGFEDPEENDALVNTLMGEWAYEQFSSIPKVGDSFEYHGLTVTVSEMEHNRILRLTVRVPEAAKGGDEA